MAGRRRDDHLIVTEGHDLELWPASGDRHDAEVDVTGEARRVHFVRAPVGELHAHARMIGQAPLDHRRQRVETDAVHRRHAHGSRDDVQACAQALLERRRPIEERRATIRLEPMKTGVFSVVRDLVVDRGALDRVVRAGGYVSVRAGSAPDANTISVGRDVAERALDAAACIGCGPCVAACPNGSAALFVGAKLAHSRSPAQGQPERARRARALVAAADAEGFGGCTLHGECVAACPKGIDLGVIARMNREYLAATLRGACRRAGLG